MQHDNQAHLQIFNGSAHRQHGGFGKIAHLRFSTLSTSLFFTYPENLHSTQPLIPLTFLSFSPTLPPSFSLPPPLSLGHDGVTEVVSTTAGRQPTALLGVCALTQSRTKTPVLIHQALHPNRPG